MKVRRTWVYWAALLLLVGCVQQTNDEAPVEPGDPAMPLLHKEGAPADFLQQVVITEGTNMAATVAADGRLVLSLQGTLFEGAMMSRTTRAITNYYQDAREPNLHPVNGSVVYQGYAAGNWDIWILPTGGGTPRALTRGPFDDREPVYNRRGDQVAFASDRSGSYDLWVLDLASERLRQITQLPANAYAPSFGAQDKSLMFAHQVRVGEAHIASVDLATGAITRLHQEQGRIHGVSVSPSGDKVVFQLLSRDAKGPVTELKLLDVKSGEVQRLSSEGADVFPFRASWIANNELLYTVDGQVQRLRLNANGKPSQQATVPFTAEFTLSRKPYQRRVRSYDSQSKGVKGIVGPVISADGAWLAFTALGDLWRSPHRWGCSRESNERCIRRKSARVLCGNQQFVLLIRPTSARPSLCCSGHHQRNLMASGHGQHGSSSSGFALTKSQLPKSEPRW